MQLRNGKQINFISKVKEIKSKKPIVPEIEKFKNIKKEMYILLERFFNVYEEYENLCKNPDSYELYRTKASSLAMDGRDLVLKLQNTFNNPDYAIGMKNYYPEDTQECHIMLMRVLYTLYKVRDRNLEDGTSALYYFTISWLLDETLKVCKELLESFGFHNL